MIGKIAIVIVGLIAGVFAGGTIAKRHLLTTNHPRAAVNHPGLSSEPRFVWTIELFPGAPSEKARLPIDPDNPVPISLEAHADNIRHSAAAMVAGYGSHAEIILWKSKFPSEQAAIHWLDSRIHAEVVPGTNDIDIWVEGAPKFAEMLAHEIANSYSERVQAAVRLPMEQQIYTAKLEDVELGKKLDADSEKLRGLIATKQGTPEEMNILRSRIVDNRRRLRVIEKRIEEIQSARERFSIYFHDSVLP